MAAGNNWFLLQAIWVSDGVLGERSIETRAAFVQLLQAHSVLAQPEDLQWLVTRAVKEERSAVPSGILLFKPKTLPAAEADASSESTEHLLPTTCHIPLAFCMAPICFGPEPALEGRS